MPKHVAEVLHVISLEGLLSRHELKHLRVRRHGVLLVIESGPKDDPVPHARFRRQGARIWALEMPTHTGVWAPTPYRGMIREMLELLMSEFPWTLTPVA